MTQKERGLSFGTAFTNRNDFVRLVSPNGGFNRNPHVLVHAGRKPIEVEVNPDFNFSELSAQSLHSVFDFEGNREGKYRTIEPSLGEYGTIYPAYPLTGKGYKSFREIKITKKGKLEGVA